MKQNLYIIRHNIKLSLFLPTLISTISWSIPKHSPDLYYLQHTCLKRASLFTHLSWLVCPCYRLFILSQFQYYLISWEMDNFYSFSSWWWIFVPILYLDVWPYQTHFHHPDFWSTCRTFLWLEVVERGQIALLKPPWCKEYISPSHSQCHRSSASWHPLMWRIGRFYHLYIIGCPS